MTNFSFEYAVNYILKREGGLSENPKDVGGITNRGISLRFLKSLSPESLRKYGLHIEVTEEDIRHLTEYQAKEIYKGEFWDHAPFDKINVQEVCSYIFDCAVNMGINPAIKCAQRATWAIMKKKDIIIDDGILGPKSILMINQCGSVILPALRSERAGVYRLIEQKNPIQKEFINGWLNRAYEG